MYLAGLLGLDRPWSFYSSAWSPPPKMSNPIFKRTIPTPGLFERSGVSIESARQSCDDRRHAHIRPPRPLCPPSPVPLSRCLFAFDGYEIRKKNGPPATCHPPARFDRRRFGSPHQPPPEPPLPPPSAQPGRGQLASMFKDEDDESTPYAPDSSVTSTPHGGCRSLSFRQTRTQADSRLAPVPAPASPSPSPISTPRLGHRSIHRAAHRIASHRIVDSSPPGLLLVGPGSGACPLPLCPPAPATPLCSPPSLSSTRSSSVV